MLLLKDFSGKFKASEHGPSANKAVREYQLDRKYNTVKLVNMYNRTNWSKKGGRYCMIREITKKK